ncbi:MAG: hypothetical protein ACKVRO_19920 [Micropepsaceae bacterium]
MVLRAQQWIDRVAPIGVIAFVMGSVLVVGGTFWEGVSLAKSLLGGDSSVTIFTDLRRAVVSVGQPLIVNGIALYVAGRVFGRSGVELVGSVTGRTSLARRWIDQNVFGIGVGMLFAGLATTMLASVRHLLPVVSDTQEISFLGVAMNAVAALGAPLAYGSALLIVAGLWLERRV